MSKGFDTSLYFGSSDMRSVIAAIASISAVGVGLGMAGPLFSLLMERDGISGSMIGAISAMAGVGGIVIIPFVTPMARRFGVVNTLAIGVAIGILSIIAFYLTDPLPWWFVWRFTITISLSILFVLSEYWINYAAADSHRGIILGIYGTMLSLGFTLGASIIAVIGIDGVMPFLLAGCIFLVSILPAFWAKDGQPVLSVEKPTQSFWPFLFVVPLATMAAFIFGAADQIQFSLLPVFGKASGYSTSAAAALITALGIGHIVFQIPLGIWSDRIKDRRVALFICAWCGVLGALLIPHVSHSLILTYLLVFFWGGSIGGLYVIGLAHLGTRVKGDDLAPANAAFAFCYCVGMAVGPQFAGISMDLFGPQNGFGWGVAMIFGLYVLVYGVRNAQIRGS